MLWILVTKGGLVSAVRWHHLTTNSGIGRLLQHKSGAVPIKAHSSHRMPRDGRLRRAAPCRQLSVCGQFFVAHPITFWEVSDGEEARSEDSDDSSSPGQYNNRRLSPSNRLPSLPPPLTDLRVTFNATLWEGGPYFTRGEVHLPSPPPPLVHVRYKYTYTLYSYTLWCTFTTLVRKLLKSDLIIRSADDIDKNKIMRPQLTSIIENSLHFPLVILYKHTNYTKLCRSNHINRIV